MQAEVHRLTDITITSLHTHKKVFLRGLIPNSVAAPVKGRFHSVQDESYMDVTVLRMLRLLKLYRILQLLRFYKQLYLLVFGYIQAMRTLPWIFILLTLSIYIFEILVKQTIPIDALSEDADFGAAQADFRFGSVSRCMWTVFELVTLEGGTDLVDLLVR